MFCKVGILLGGLAQDVPDLPQLQLAVLAGVRLVKQLLGVAERTLLQQRSTSQVPFHIPKKYVELAKSFWSLPGQTAPGSDSILLPQQCLLRGDSFFL